MKATRLFATALATWLCCTTLSAQETYPPEMFSAEMACPVAFTGTRPTISDFVTAYFSDDDDGYPEIWGDCMMAWNAYKQGSKLPKGSAILLDTKNGYMRFTQNLGETYGDDWNDKDVYTVEMCYWNCTDNRYKVFGISLYGMEHGKYVGGQYDGITLYIYDNATRKMYQVPTEDMGVTLSYDSQGDEYPIHVIRLPRTGKNIIQETYLGNRKTVRKYRWDGMRFK